MVVTERARLIVLVASVLACSVAFVARANPHSSDCLKNPFATGCRGISAKRSVLPSWTQLDNNVDFYRLLSTPSQTSGWPSTYRTSTINQQEMAQLKLQQLVNAVELLVETTSRLIPLASVEQQQLATMGSRRLCRELYSLDGASESQKRPATTVTHKEEA